MFSGIKSVHFVLIGGATSARTVAVMNIVGAYYPKDKVPVKAQYLVEGLFAEGQI